jgi:eukaryotic-like serine/threonine-protein kinase
MTPERWERLKSLFQGALDRPAAERDHWLLDASGADAELLREARALLHSHDTAGDFLDAPVSVDPDEIETLPPGSHLGQHYEIQGVLGRGGMGIVYLAHDYRLGRRVALKALPPLASADAALRERLTREARAAATIAHPAVATVFALEEIDGNLYIASEYVPGETLAQEIARGPLPAVRAHAVAVDIVKALTAAHAAGVVHRDLKPENVLITVDGVKVVDFGIARMDGIAGTRLTRDGALLGTPAYMAPEQLVGTAVDARADIYTFGVILSEMLTGRHPLMAGDAAPSHAPDALSERMRAISARCLETDPSARFSSAAELLTALQQAAAPATLDGEPVTGALWWWRFHQAATAVVYAAMVYPLWIDRGLIGGMAGRLLFVAGLTAIIGAVTLRLHLWFTSRFYRSELEWARRRNGRWLIAADAMVAAALIGGGLAIGDQRAPLGDVLIAMGVIGALAFLVIEPVTARAAFRGK